LLTVILNLIQDLSKMILIFIRMTMRRGFWTLYHSIQG